MRSALRSRMVLFLLLLLFAAVVGLPLTVQGDGTPGGQVQILVRYTLGAGMLILSLAAVWAGCAAISTDLESRRLHLVATKPVSMLQVWMGAWAGLSLLVGLLLAASGAATWVLLLRNLREWMGDPTQRTALEQEILVARRVVRAESIDVDGPALQRFREHQERGTLPDGVSRETAFEAIRQLLLQQAYAVPPGGRRSWTFSLPARRDDAQPLLLRFRFSSSRLGAEKVAGLWQVRRGDQGRSYRWDMEAAAQIAHGFQVPAEFSRGDGPLVVEFSNTHEQPVTVLFRPEDGLELLLYEGTFGPNYARALLRLYLQLAFYAAMGVTAGALLSMPVAALVGVFVLLMAQMADAIRSMASQPAYYLAGQGSRAVGPLVHGLLRKVYGTLHLAAAPLRMPPVLEQLTTGEWIGWGEVARALLVQGVLGALLLGGLSACVLRRRELALPD